MINQPIEEKWKEVADELWELLPPGFSYRGVNRKTMYNWIKTRLENLLEQERKRMSDEIEKLKQYNSHIGIGGLHSADMQIVHNDAIDKALSIINK